jgi:hypothetical protein
VANGDGEDALFVSQISVHEDALLRHRQQTLSGFEAGTYTRFSSAEIDYTDLRYDPQTGEFSLGLVVAQPLNAPRTWPLVLRVHRVTSPLGPILAEEGDNRGSGRGASWVFDGPATPLPAGSRADLRKRSPYRAGYEFSKPRTLRFRLQGPANPHSLEDLMRDGKLLQVDFEVYRK